jgi:cation:H+ antiporter
MSVFLVIGSFLLGCGLLAWGADRMIVSSVSIARYFNLPSIFTGMLLVGFGTCFPELAVAIIASVKGNAHLAVGNIIGSNIANIGMVVGIAALITPIRIHSRLLKREFPILIVASCLVGGLIWNHFLSRWDGIILLVFLGIYLYWLLRSSLSREVASDEIVKEYQQEVPAKLSMTAAWLWWLVGLGLLFVASNLLVDSATTIAKWLKMSDFVIGLTVVAIGTSLPELAVTAVSAFRGEHDIAIGNVVGSNIFNLLAVLAVPAIVAPSQLPAKILTTDFPMMMAFTLLLWLFSLKPLKDANINRVEAFCLLMGFFGYLSYLLFF